MEPLKGSPASASLAGAVLMRRRPTLPHTFACSTIGPAGLNFRVRDGNGWNPRGKITARLSALGRGQLALGNQPLAKPGLLIANCYLPIADI
jgi:hypothetical protein